MRLRIGKPDENTIAHILAITAIAFIALIVLGLGRPSSPRGTPMSENHAGLNARA